MESQRREENGHNYTDNVVIGSFNLPVGFVFAWSNCSQNQPMGGREVKL